ncbi:MAG: NAD(+)/NADH kinase [Burkholderiales bacterium]|nr:NAD(+)/NADH kinase [Burkholderiales bacterium]
MLKFRKVAIIARPDSIHLTNSIHELADMLQTMGITTFIDNNFLGSNQPTSSYKYCKVDDFLSNIELAIIIGGDGTLLAAARKIVSHNIPIIGINHGNLGFMTDIPANDMLETVKELIENDDHEIDERNLISAKIIRNENIIYTSLALNDFVISRGLLSSMIEISISIDDEFVCTQKSDGLIITTPTGSTAYALASGGPILHPASKAIAIVPICPQSMSNRPIVVSDNSEIQIMMLSKTEAVVHSDGQESFTILPNDLIVIHKSTLPLRLLHAKNYSYYRTLRNKLHWAKRLS